MKEIKPLSFIYEIPNSLTPEFCKQVIEQFEKDDRKEPGVVGSLHELNPDIKTGTDLPISTFKEWKEIDQVFFKSLAAALEDLAKTIPWLAMTGDFGYQIQRSQPGERYTYHFDADGPFEGGPQSQNRRQVVAIWYLNDVAEGGETEFLLQDIKVKPEVGKLVFFPPFWTHYHRGVSPVSETKYICTTWIRSL